MKQELQKAGKNLALFGLVTMFTEMNQLVPKRQ